MEYLCFGGGGGRERMKDNGGRTIIKFYFTRQSIALEANIIKTVTEIVPATEIATLFGCDAKFVWSGG